MNNFKKCSKCGKPATCRRRYEDSNNSLEYSCNECCINDDKNGLYHPISQPYGFFICSPDHPMPKNAEGQWEHTSAHETGDQENGWPGGDIIRMKCNDCGTTWKEELPQ